MPNVSSVRREVYYGRALKYLSQFRALTGGPADGLRGHQRCLSTLRRGHLAILTGPRVGVGGVGQLEEDAEQTIQADGQH